MTNWPTVATEVHAAFSYAADVALVATGERLQVITARADAWSTLSDLDRQHPGFRLARAASIQPVYLIYPQGMTAPEAAALGEPVPVNSPAIPDSSDSLQGTLFDLGKPAAPKPYGVD